MYYNDTHILWYLLFAIIGGIIGQFIDYCSRAFIKEKKILKKETFKEYKQTAMVNYILIISMIISYIAILYKFGLNADITKNLELIKYLLLIPMILCAFFVDLKEQIIPNRLNLLMFEIGLVFVFLNGILNINLAINMLLRNACRRRNILNYYINRWAYCRKRSNGTSEMLN